MLIYDNKINCCGCGACMNICPKQAISIKPDEYGFIYPEIDEIKCIECGLCKKVCGYQAEIIVPVINHTYVAVAKDENILANSASGGVFASLASEVINHGGVVFGCAMEMVNNKLTPKHIMIDELKDLIKLQGSKYVQSFIGDTYNQVKNALNVKPVVLFCGTPCQIDGLKYFLQMKEYDNLITVDLICHGVPNAQMFQDYISKLEKKLKGKIIDYKFRDKSKSWGSNEKAVYLKSNTELSKLFSSGESSYYSLFLESSICRENCYSCKYANSNRVGDLTIGDFWGIEKEHPQYLKDIHTGKGVSCIIANTENGRKTVNTFCGNLKLFPSNIQKAANQNNQLNHPSRKPKERDVIMELYKEKGYFAVDEYWKKAQGIKYYISIIKSKIPQKVKTRIKIIMRRKF